MVKFSTFENKMFDRLLGSKAMLQSFELLIAGPFGVDFSDD